MLFQIKAKDGDQVSKAMSTEVGDADDDDPHRQQVVPSLVLRSSSSTSSSSSASTRRVRSASINLPPEPEVLQSIGRSLRRLSDEFQIRREQAGHARRRQTITSMESYYRSS